MALPLIQKSWQLIPNINSGTNRQQILLDRKNAYCGTAFGGFQITQNAWRVIRSSNGTAVANSDLWNSTADINRGATAGSNRSWTILQNALGRQWLWDYRGSDASNVFLSMSPAGLFTGGTISSAPTAPDALGRDPNSDVSVTHDILNANRLIQHIWHSGDGKQTLNLSIQSGGECFIWLFGDTDDAPADWVHPTLMWTDSATDGVSSQLSNKLVGGSGANHLTAEESVGVFASCHFIGEAYGALILQVSGSGISIVNELSGQFDHLDKFYVGSLREASAGPLGYWPDMWPTMPSQTGYATGDHFPSDAAIALGAAPRQYVKFNDLILPWFGAPAMVTA